MPYRDEVERRKAFHNGNLNHLDNFYLHLECYYGISSNVIKCSPLLAYQKLSWPESGRH